ncbi:demethylmenaquinone methyltransferase [bacterium BMS3Abin14]|nr:demethylmenaquinone methyltransferase [bacterium BMS3Abin14]
MTKEHKQGSQSIRRMFSSIAGRYDLLNHILSLGVDIRWRKELAKEVPGPARSPILDLATGTGDVALTLVQELTEEVKVVGADFTVPMLDQASVKVGARGKGRIALTAGDAMALPFPDDTFGAVTIAFGLRNLPDRLGGLDEMFRVLRPGGRVIVLELSPIDHGLLGPLFHFYFHHILPVLGGVISGRARAYRYLPNSVDSFPSPKALGEEMSGAGFGQVRFRSLTLGIAFLHVGEKPD